MTLRLETDARSVTSVPVTKLSFVLPQMANIAPQCGSLACQSPGGAELMSIQLLSVKVDM